MLFVHWLLITDHWSLVTAMGEGKRNPTSIFVIRYSLFVICSLVTGHWLLITGHWSLPWVKGNETQPVGQTIELSQNTR
ncbi:hypothetical protein [Dactylococcopsis salina]|uniref:hypothetical protein n=1 Tax=Dactylococcopsis salina TaxID=292566 RepID=UPI0003074E3F|nr:hypothetical protein [Dactylococcopsis salina]